MHGHVKWLTSWCIISARPDLLVPGHILIDQQTPHECWLGDGSGRIKCENGCRKMYDMRKEHAQHVGVC